MTDGWDESAGAWIAEQGDLGDYSRQFVLDAPMMARARGKGFRKALDVGCGEGRFCRMLAAEDIETSASIRHERSSSAQKASTLEGTIDSGAPKRSTFPTIRSISS